MNAERRRTKLVNNDIQLCLARRMLSHWALAWVLIFTLPIIATLGYGMISSEISAQQMLRNMVGTMWFPVIMSLLIMPFVIWDTIRFSHRFAGPMVRLRNDLKRLNDGIEVKPVRLRKGDFLHDFAAEFNRLIETRAKNESSEKRPSQPPADDSKETDRRRREIVAKLSQN